MATKARIKQGNPIIKSRGIIYIACRVWHGRLTLSPMTYIRAEVDDCIYIVRSRIAKPRKKTAEPSPEQNSSCL